MVEQTDDDRGLPNERTTLGWRRTGLAAAGLSAVVVRTRVDRFDASAIVTVVLAVAVVLTILTMTFRRSATSHRDGRGAALLALLISLIAAVQFALILVG